LYNSLRKSSIKLAGISKDENDGEQQRILDLTQTSSEQKSDSTTVAENNNNTTSPSKPEKRKGNGKSFRNLFGLLSFSGGKSKNTSSENPTVEDENDRLVSVDNITLEKLRTNTNTTTEEADVTSTEGASSVSTESSNTAAVGKLEIDPLTSSKDTEASTVAPSTVSSVDTNQEMVSSNETGTTSNNSSPQSAPRRPSMLKKLRSKSIHRVVTVRSAAQHGIEEQLPVEQLQTSQSPQQNDEENTDDSIPPAPQFSPMNSPYIHQGTTDSPLKTSLKTAAFQLFSNVSEESKVENETNKEAVVNLPKPEKMRESLVERRDSYEIVDAKGRKRSITAISENAPLPPPPPEIVVPPSCPVVVESPDGKRIPITVLSPNAPVVPPPPPSSPSVTSSLLSPIHRPSIDRMTTEEHQHAEQAADRSLPQTPPSTPIIGASMSAPVSTAVPVVFSDVSPLLKRSLKPPPPPPPSPMIVRPLIPVNLANQELEVEERGHEDEEERGEQSHEEDGKQLSYHNMLPSEEEIQEVINEEIRQSERFEEGLELCEEEPFVHLEEN
jgi:hypothetical protein